MNMLRKPICIIYTLICVAILLPNTAQAGAARHAFENYYYEIVRVCTNGAVIEFGDSGSTDGGEEIFISVRAYLPDDTDALDSHEVVFTRPSQDEAEFRTLHKLEWRAQDVNTPIRFSGTATDGNDDDNNFIFPAEACDAFTYQGQLIDDGGAANGQYDFRFNLFKVESDIGDPDAFHNESQGEEELSNVTVSNGVFTAELDFSEFGRSPWDGSSKWLEIEVKENGEADSEYVKLSPRQSIKPSPYAHYSHDGYVTFTENGAGSGGESGLNLDEGVQLGDVPGDAFSVDFAGDDGLHIRKAAQHGIIVEESGFDGLFICATGGEPCEANFDEDQLHHGIQIYDAKESGIQINTAGTDAIYINNAGDDGLHINGAGDDAIFINDAANDGIQISNAAEDGIEINNAATGIYVHNVTGKAAVFNGDVEINGYLSNPGAFTQIDHPLDPANKYLSHSFVESADMMNIYNGNAILDSNGEATVILPEWFEVINRDFRYQLTPIGAPGPNLYIAQKIVEHQFKIAGGTQGMEVSWMVTGIRQDPFAKANPIPVEEVKSDAEKGTYIHPELYGASPELQVESQRRAILENEKTFETAQSE